MLFIVHPRLSARLAFIRVPSYPGVLPVISIVWLAIALPIIGFLYCALVGSRLDRRYCGYAASAAVGLAFVVALGVLASLLGLAPESRHVVVPLWTWITSGSLSVGADLLVDPLSALMLVIVTGVGFLIHVYATGYMRGDPGYARFFAYLNLFVTAMLTLVLANNFLLLMVGWGGVGLCSYLLIAFWFDRPEAARAGVKAFVVNSIGDVGLLLAAFLIATTFGTLEYDAVFSAAPTTLGEGSATATAIALLLLVGAAAKSAQLPLYGWLPDAMAGPTPVSALIHAATMVTAGVYLICRTFVIFELSPVAMMVVAVVGAATALFAATSAIVKPNIKRVLAYSTVSQLGLMFVAVGVGGFAAGLFHLADHAFFKALLFLAAGAVIHALGGEEDLFKMGGLKQKLPVVYWTFLVGALALAGFPLLSGFFSKDEIIYAAFVSPRGGWALGVAALVVTAFTGFYVFRAFFLAFHNRPAPAGQHLHRPGVAMTAPLVLLAALSVVAGYVQFPGLGLEEFLRPAFTRYAVPELVHPAFDGTYWTIAAVAAIAALLGIGAAYGLYYRENQLPQRLTWQLSGAFNLLQRDWHVEDAYGILVVRPLFRFAGWLGGGFDSTVDRVVDGVGALTRRSSAALGSFETGKVRTYALVMLGGAVLVVAGLAFTNTWRL